jgi:hypothetical protein
LGSGDSGDALVVGEEVDALVAGGLQELFDGGLLVVADFEG